MLKVIGVLLIFLKLLLLQFWKPELQLKFLFFEGAQSLGIFSLHIRPHIFFFLHVIPLLFFNFKFRLLDMLFYQQLYL
jgi:hypothetical protein